MIIKKQQRQIITHRPIVREITSRPKLILIANVLQSIFKNNIPVREYEIYPVVSSNLIIHLLIAKILL